MGEYCGYPLVCNFLSINAYQPAMPWHRNKAWKVQTSLNSLNHLVTTLGAERRVPKNHMAHDHYPYCFCMNRLYVEYKSIPPLGDPICSWLVAIRADPTTHLLFQLLHLLGSTKEIARCAPFRRTLRQENRYLLHKGWWSFWCGFPRKTHQNKGKSSQNIMSSWFLWMFQIHNIHQNEPYPNFRPATTPERPPKGPTAHVLFLTTEMSSLPESDLGEIDLGTYWSFPEICMVTPTQPRLLCSFMTCICHLAINKHESPK